MCLYPLWGMGRHAWGEVHFWIAMVLIAAVALHLFLHWGWVTAMIKGKTGPRRGLPVALAIVLTAAVLAIAAAPFFMRVQAIGSASDEAEHSAVTTGTR